MFSSQVIEPEEAQSPQKLKDNSHFPQKRNEGSEEAMTSKTEKKNHIATLQRMLNTSEHVVN